MICAKIVLNKKNTLNWQTYKYNSGHKYFVKK